MSSSVDSAVSEILQEGLDDWVPIDQVIGEAREIAASSGAPLPEVATVIIRRLIEGGYMVPGEIGDDGFQAWEGTPGELVARVVRGCEELDWAPAGAGSWLANTATGDQVAESETGSDAPGRSQRGPVMTARWYPANSIERELASALSGSNYPRYFRTFRSADIHLPWRYAEADPDDWEPVTREFAGRTVLPVFTSDESLAAGFHETADGVMVISFEELRTLWPDPEWGLAINPGLPIEAYLPLDAVEPAARGELLPRFSPELIIGTLPDHMWQEWGPGGPHEALFDAVSQGDGREYLDALFACTVTVPTTREVDETELWELRRASTYNPGLGPVDAALRERLVRAGAPAESLEQMFPWRFGNLGNEPAIEVFTRADMFGQADQEMPSVQMSFVDLLRLMPAGHALSVNPRGPAGLDLPAEHVPLLRGWYPSEPIPYPLLWGMRWARVHTAEPPSGPLHSRGLSG